MKMDKLLLFLTSLMFIIGLFMIFSASSVESSLTGEPYHYFIRQGIILIGCSIAFIFVINIPLKFYKKTALMLLLFILGSLIVVYLYGSLINRAKSWINLGFFNYQPSEFAKMAIIIYMGVYYNKHRDIKTFSEAIVPLVGAIAVCALTFIQPDFGTTAIIVAITAAIFFAVPMDKEIKSNVVKFAALIVAVAVIFLLATDSSILKSGQASRLDYRNPCSKYLTGGSGYQVCNGFIAINNGGLWGVGLGNSTQKYLYLPEAHTDFIFAIMLEELGLVICSLIILTHITILLLILKIGRKSYNLMGSIICYGTAVYIFLHIFINLGGVLGLIPLTGVPLPFLSYGGSYALNLSILLALVQRVEIENKKHYQEKLLKEGKLTH